MTYTHEVNDKLGDPLERITFDAETGEITSIELWSEVLCSFEEQSLVELRKREWAWGKYNALVAKILPDIEKDKVEREKEFRFFDLAGNR